MNHINPADNLYLLTRLIPIERLSKSGLSPSLFETLHLLASHGAMNLSDLAGLRRVRKSSMSATMAQLVANQLVIHATSKSDARQKLYLITNKGRTLYQETLNEGQTQLDQYWSDYSSEQQQLFYAMLQSLLSTNHD